MSFSFVTNRAAAIAAANNSSPGVETNTNTNNHATIDLTSFLAGGGVLPAGGLSALAAALASSASPLTATTIGPADGPRFVVGQPVILRGLTRAAMNGKTGEMLAWNAVTGRFSVRLDGSDNHVVKRSRARMCTVRTQVP
jgi:hypothetical protein